MNRRSCLQTAGNVSAVLRLVVFSDNCKVNISIRMNLWR